MSSSRLDELPVELMLKIAELCDLKSLIKLRSISKSWRALVMQNYYGCIHPTRRKLLDFYDFCLDSGYFRTSREDIIPCLKPFDRNRYLELLSDQSLPEEFDMWIREWPARAVIGCLWPGMGEDCDQPAWWRPDVGNALSNQVIEARSNPAAVGKKLFVDRKKLLEEGIQEDPHTPSNHPDFACFGVTAIRIQDGRITENETGSYIESLAGVELIVANGQPWHGIVHYNIGFLHWGDAIYMGRGLRSPTGYASSWVEYMKYQLGAHEQLHLLRKGETGAARGELLPEYYRPVHNATYWPGHGSDREPSEIFKSLLPIVRADGTRYFRGVTLPPLPEA